MRVLVGSDAALRAEAQARLAQAWLGDQAAAQTERFDLREQPLSAVLEAAASAPLFAARRLIVARALDAVAAADHPPLLAYLARPVPTTLLLFWADKLDARQKLSQALQRAGAIERVAGPTSHGLQSFVLARARERGMALLPAAAAALCERVGADVGLLAQSLEKLSLYQPGPAAIDVADVHTVVAPTREASIFALTDAVTSGPWNKASAALAALLTGGEEPLVILAMLVRQVRLLLAAQGPRPVTGVPPFVAESLKRHAARIPRDALRAALADLQACDAALKRSRVAPLLILERAVWPLATAAARCAATASTRAAR